VEREHTVVGVRAHDGPVGREVLDPEGHGEEAADDERQCGEHQVHQGDALVIEGEQPGLDPGVGVHVVDGRVLGIGRAPTSPEVVGNLCHRVTAIARFGARLPSLFDWAINGLLR
jgi:hypothetical protein